jgi:hypothetical protein
MPRESLAGVVGGLLAASALLGLVITVHAADVDGPPGRTVMEADGTTSETVMQQPKATEPGGPWAEAEQPSGESKQTDGSLARRCTSSTRQLRRRRSRYSRRRTEKRQKRHRRRRR